MTSDRYEIEMCSAVDIVKRRERKNKIVIHFVLWATEKYFLRTTKSPTLNVYFFGTRYFRFLNILCSFALSHSFRSNCTSFFFAILYALIDGFSSLHIWTHDIIGGASVCLTRTKKRIKAKLIDVSAEKKVESFGRWKVKFFPFRFAKTVKVGVWTVVIYVIRCSWQR
jgi:hypothetical protein